MITRIVKSKWTYLTIRIAGFFLLGVYLFSSNDWRVSIYWVLAFPAIAFFISWLVIALKIADRIPSLNRRFLYPSNDRILTSPLTDGEWALAQANYLDSGMQGISLFTSPTEDGLVCVPVLVAGLGLLTSALGGAVFALLHVGRFTYLECVGKGVYYGLACFLILPHGLLNIVLGHLLMNLIGLAVIKASKHALSKKVAL